MMRINKKLQLVGTAALMLVLALCFLSCERIKKAYGKKGELGPGGGTIAPVFAVAVIPAAQGSISDYFAVSGDIVAVSTVDAYSDAAGKISRLYVSVGSRVNKDDPIAAVDPSRPGLDYVVSIVKAPISGTIVALPAQVGMTISQAVPIARVAGGSGLEIKLNIAERFISRISLGLSCEITLDAYPGQVFNGRVSEISPVVDPASRTLEIKISVNNTRSLLKAGMFAKVRVITERKENIVKIPASAMLNRFGEQYVFAVDKDPEDPEQSIVRKKIVVPGILIDGILEIQNGLEPDEEIVIRGQTLIDDGSRVNIVERFAPLAAN